MADYEEEKKKKGQQISDSFKSANDSGKAWENLKAGFASAAEALSMKDEKKKKKDE